MSVQLSYHAILAGSKEKIRVIKENLENCKVLLNCKRDELKKLWLEGIEHKQVLYLLQQIENLKDVPEKVERYVLKKHYLHATELLVSSLNTLQGDLEGIEALSEVRQELQTKKEGFYETLLEELHRHLYTRSISEVFVGFHRHGSNRVGEGMVSSFSRRGSEREPKDIALNKSKILTLDGRRESTTPVKRNLLEPLMSTPTHKYRTTPFGSPLSLSPPLSELDKTAWTGPVTEDLLISEPEEDSIHFMAILVECLVQLNKIPEAVEAIKNRIQKELCLIVRRTSQQFYEIDDDTRECLPHTSRLLQLLELLFKQYHLVAHAHECVLNNLRRFENGIDRNDSPFTDVQLYDMADYWSRVQAVLQMLLSEYLDVENTSSGAQHAPSAFAEATADVSSFFAKKKPLRQKKFSLFKFESSSHAISLNTYLKEQQTLYGSSEVLHSGSELVTTEDKNYICKPDVKNITVIFIPLMKLIDDIKLSLGYVDGAQCSLYTFVTEFVKEVFLGRVHSEVMSSIEASTKEPNAWKSHIDLNTQKLLDVSRPLLQNTVCVQRHIDVLRKLMQDLPLYADTFLNMICNILVMYKDACHIAYQAVVQPESEDQRVISAMWAKDEDINRFLRSLPNWTNVLSAHSGTSAAHKRTDIEESPEEIRLRNKKESEILTGNLGDTLIPHHEILSDVTQLRILALLQESLDWFGGQVQHLASSLPTESNMQYLVSPGSTMMLPVSASSVQSLKQLAREFEDLAEICLLVLHLEVRLHCFYYLMPTAKQASFASAADSQDPDPEIVKLNKDLSNIEEAMSASLQSQKFQYIFEGLSHLVASIIINSAQYIKRINSNGVKKMCRNIFAIQQNLTNITLSQEVALDHARRYFEMLQMTPQEILNMVVEQRPFFSELEYVNALQLLHRSQPGSDPAEFQANQKRLQEILNEVAVAI